MSKGNFVGFSTHKLNLMSIVLILRNSEKHNIRSEYSVVPLYHKVYRFRYNSHVVAPKVLTKEFYHGILPRNFTKEL